MEHVMISDEVAVLVNLLIAFITTSVFRVSATATI